MVKLQVEFAGGLDLLFNHRRKLHLDLDRASPVTIKDLIEHLCEYEMSSSRKDLFVQDGTIRPGVLVLINDTDWELEGEENYMVQDGDNIMFASTLHGG